MAVTPARARALALSLENAASYPHFDRIAFRTPRRTFATLALSGVDLNFMFDLEQQAYFCELAPRAIAPVAGGWGRMGATRCDLKLIDLATFKAALLAAHARANAPLAKKGAKASLAKKGAKASLAKKGAKAPLAKKGGKASLAKKGAKAPLTKPKDHRPGLRAAELVAGVTRPGRRERREWLRGRWRAVTRRPQKANRETAFE